MTTRTRATVGVVPGDPCQRELRRTDKGTGQRVPIWEKDAYGRSRLARCKGVVAVQARGWNGSVPVSWVGCDACGWAADRPCTEDIPQEPIPGLHDP